MGLELAGHFPLLWPKFILFWNKKREETVKKIQKASDNDTYRSLNNPRDNLISGFNGW